MRTFLQKIGRWATYAWGLNHSVGHLVEISDEIPFWPIEKQSEYADNVVRKFARNETFLKEQFPEPLTIDPSGFDNWNSISIGNMAFMVLHTSDERVKEHCKNTLAAYVQWKRENLNNH